MIGNIIATLFLVLCCYAAYRNHSLSVNGGIAAFVVGLAVFYGFGLKGFILLGVFFVSSSFWSKYKSSKKSQMEEKLAKGSVRDWRQVLANGGAAALLGLIHFFDERSVWIIAFAVALSSANSDTWASEIGSLSKKNPIDIRTFARIEKGTSGAISLLGSIAALAGSFLIAIFSYWLFNLHLISLFYIFSFGFLGSVIDTILGAFYQLKFQCQTCGILTEKKVHCGRPTIRIKGITFVDNDMVNFISGLIAVLIVIAVTY